MNAEAVLNQVLSHVLTCVSTAVQIVPASEGIVLAVCLT